MHLDTIAEEFVQRYQRFWRDGAEDVRSVYVPDAILCGYDIVKSAADIGSTLAAIYGQGWTEISIEIVQTASAGNTVLLACRYTARSESDEMSAKSSYVLLGDEGIWKAAMHTAT